MKYELPEEISKKEYDLLHISVRDLVEFVLRSGDIDDRISSGVTTKAMQEGSRIHRMLQKKGGGTYHAEVPLKITIDCDDYILGIEGRADGLIYEGEEITERSTVCVDEIKGVYMDLDLLAEPQLLHLAQAKCYAAILCQKHGLSAIDVQITYCNMDTEEVRRFRDTYSSAELSDWFYDVIGKYRRWSDFQFYFRITRQNSIAALEFPFPYRPGQKDLAAGIYRSIHRNKLIFIQAPTGSGKTISAIFPAVKAVGENEAERIFYLTAKTVTRTVARDTFQILEDRGYRGKTVVITAKDKMCPLEERKCNPVDCPYAKGHFDRINDAVYDILQSRDIFDAPDILAFAKERMVCPFEFNLDISSWCDNIICDYNYVFDPNVYLKRFFSEGISCEGIFLIDEAHNLVERGREMYSETLVKEEFLEMKKPFKVYQGGIVRNLDKCNKKLLEWKRQTEGEYLMVKDISSFLLQLNNLSGALERFFEKKIELDDMDRIREFYFKIKNFLNLSDGMDHRYCTYCDFDEEGRFCLHLYCMDPSYLLQQRLDRGNGAVFFSATFLPVNYYKKLLCTDPDPYAMYASSVFDRSHRGLFIGRDVTSRYKNRTTEQYDNIASYIYEVTSKKTGNYMVFFPSYLFLNRVAEAYENKYNDHGRLLLQSSGMKEAERESFLGAFINESPDTLIGFCVLGGVFSEGIDLKNDRLIGAIIVGTGLPQISNRRKILSDHFDEEERNGFLYAYLYPGMNKVMQAAGRVIRTVEDYGIIVLLDERFLYTDYKSTFPREWQDHSVETLDTIGAAVENFWENVKK
ncbi:MAG: ATP-dependent DNA helicase [Lachnospiraceae bacterium]|nr:ATP-dependent DNA helicase [Lachnospiraceae bacterium]